MNAEKILQKLLGIYLVFTGFLLPLYIPDGYRNIAEDKFILFRNITAVLIAAAVILVIIGRKNIRIRKISLTDKAVLIYWASMTVSFFGSVNRSHALFGEVIWRMGYLTQCMCLVLYFIYAHLYKWNRNSLYLLLSGSFFVNILALLNRFGILIFDEMASGTDAVSTIGNINWLAGYLSVMVPAAVCLYLTCTDRKESYLLTAYMAAAFPALIVNGSNAVWFWMVPVLVMTALYGLTDRSAAGRAVTVFLILSLSLLFFRLLSIADSRLYQKVLCIDDSYSRMLTSGYIAPVLSLVSAAVLWTVNRKRSEDKQKKAHLLIYPAAVLLAAPVLLLSVQVFRFAVIPDAFGNNRGAIWRISEYAYRHFSVYRKLFGTGPDCFGLYVSETSDVFMQFYTVFSFSKVTTPHSMLLEVLINLGLAGLVGFLLVYTAVFTKISERLKNNDLMAVILLISIISLTFNNMVSFSQIMTVPYFWLLVSCAAGELNEI